MPHTSDREMQAMMRDLVEEYLAQELVEPDATPTVEALLANDEAAAALALVLERRRSPRATAASRCSSGSE